MQEFQENYLNQKERMNPQLENMLKSNSTDLADNPAFPKTDANGNPINFLELIAYKRFLEVVERVKRYTNLTNVTGQAGMSRLTPMLMQGIGFIEQVEQPHKLALENLAVDLVVEEMEIPDGVFQFQCKIVNRGEINQDGFQKETKEPSEEEINQTLSNEAEGENMTPSEFFEMEKHKRRFINMLIQGSSKKGHYMFELVRNKLNEYNPNLAKSYGEVMSINDLIYWLLDDETINQMASQPSAMAGKEEIEQSEDGTIIKTEAICFPVSLHEIIKGVMETFGTQGLPDDPQQANMVIDAVDSLSNETMDLRLGAIIWEKFIYAYPRMVFDEGNRYLQHYLFSRFCGLETTEFFRVSRMIMANDPKGAKYMERMTDEIISDLNVDEFEENKGDNEDDINIDDLFNYKTGGQTKNKKGDIGKSGTQYGYTLKEWDKIAEKNGLLVSPTQWWKSQEGKKYKDFVGRNKIVGQHSGDKAQEMNKYGYMIANGMDLGSDKIPASAKKYVQENNLNKFGEGGEAEFNPTSLLGTFLYSQTTHGHITDIRIISEENIKVEYTTNSNTLSIERSFTKQELYDMTKGKKIRGYEMPKSMAEGGNTTKSFLHLYKLTYPNGQYVVEAYDGFYMTPKEALEKMRISLRGLKSYKYSGASSDSDNYKKWYEKKDIGYSNTEAWDEVFGGSKMALGGKAGDDEHTHVDLFEDYENIPANVQEILDEYDLEEDSDYDTLLELQNRLETIGYTFEYGLDAVPYGLRPSSVKLNKLEGYENEEYAEGGEAGDVKYFYVKGRNEDAPQKLKDTYGEFYKENELIDYLNKWGNNESVSFNEIVKVYENGNTENVTDFYMNKYAEGGEAEFDIYDYDKKMALINLGQVYEYAIKLDKIIKDDTDLEEWVKMKLTRIEQNISDVKHSLEGWEKYEDGGEIPKKQLLHIAKYSKDLIEMISNGSKLMSWQEDKLAISSASIDDIYHHLDYEMGNRAEDLDVDDEYGRGGFVSKGELVWKKLSSSDKINFLNENFTPQITARTQQTLTGKAYNFLPKNVKIVLQSKYANVEDYAGGGKVLAKLKKLKSEMKQIWEETGEQYSDKKEMLMSAGYNESDANDLKHEEWKYLGNDVQIKLINDYFAYYEQLAVYVQGVGSIYNGTSMQTAVNKAKSYLKNNPKAEIVISDEKYGDTYDLDGYMIDDEYAYGGEIQDWMEKALQSLIEETGNNNLQIFYVRKNDFTCQDDDGEEYRVFENEDLAYDYAVEEVESDLEYQPENFNREFLMEYVEIGDLFVNDFEMTNYQYTNDIKDEKSEKYENRLIEELVANGLISEEEAQTTNFRELDEEFTQDYIDLLTNEQIGDDNGITHFIDNFGENEFFALVYENNLIDVEYASKKAVEIDGVAHFLAGYDGETIYLDNNNVAYRTN